MKIIDCHTHLQDKKLINEYFSISKGGFAVAIKALDNTIGNGDAFYDAVKEDERLFIIDCIDVFCDIQKQLVHIDNLLKDKRFRLIGIKIYLGYQPICADDERLFAVYEFARERNLSICFHCGVGASNLNCVNYKDFASCKPLSKLAKRFKDLNFIISHFNYPNMEDCAKVISENANVYTDISGQYENFDNLPYNQLMEEFLGEITPLLKKYKHKELYKKVMFGTDFFGKASGFNAVNEYIETLKIMFGEDKLPFCLYENQLKAYPRIKQYLSKEK